MESKIQEKEYERDLGYIKRTERGLSSQGPKGCYKEPEISPMGHCVSGTDGTIPLRGDTRA